MQRLFPQRMLIRFRRDDCGGALVEFAFVLPILLLMLFGIIGWGMSLSMHNAMYDTARSCARSVAIGAVEADDVDGTTVCRVQGWPATFTVAGLVETGNAVVTVTTPNPMSMVAHADGGRRGERRSRRWRRWRRAGRRRRQR